MSEPIYQIQLRRGTAAEWTATNPVLAEGEPGFETDTGKFKLGNGVLPWVDLPYTVDLSHKADIESPTFTGNPKAPTPPLDDNDTSIATTAYVVGMASTNNPKMDGVAHPGASKRYSRSDHVHPSDPALSQETLDSRYVNLTGDIMTGGLTIDRSGDGQSAGVFLNGNAGTQRRLIMRTNGKDRWTINTNVAAETGGNAGSDLTFYRFDDAGNYIDTPLSINRQTGRVAGNIDLQDTGWRNISDLLGNNFTGPNHIFIRRMGKRCTLSVIGVTRTTAISAAGVSMVGVAPAGFAPSGLGIEAYAAQFTNLYDPYYTRIETGTIFVLGYGSSAANGLLVAASAPANMHWYGKFDYITDDPWPIAYPGIPA